MLSLIFIFIGAGCGGVLRFLVSETAYVYLGRQFPIGTLLVNVSGCFLMGLLCVLLLERFSSSSPQFRAFVLIGFLGGYTTFSSFSFETLSLFEKGASYFALANVFLSIILCLVATWVGITGGKYLSNVSKPEKIVVLEHEGE